MVSPGSHVSIALYLSTLVSILHQQILVQSLAVDKLPVKHQQIDREGRLDSNNSQSPTKREDELLPKYYSQINKQNQASYQQDLRRPIWALAHMVNSIKELDYRLRKGANAIESDVTFGRDGDPLYVYHGPPCDCLRHCHQQEDLSDFLSYVREIAIDEPHGVGKNLSLLLLDLKLGYLDQKGKARAGTELAKSILTNLYLDSPASREILLQRGELENPAHQHNISTPRGQLKLVLSVNHVSDIELIIHFMHYFEQHNSSHLLSRIGFDVGMNDDLQLIESMWKRFGGTVNLWQGDGFTNCFSPFYNLERLSRALTRRDNPQGYPKKVYHWTIDLHDRMRESLKLGVDAMITNHPERLAAILNEPEFAHDFRLATQADDPFKKIINRAGSRSSESARFQRSAMPSDGGFLSNVYDVISSWLAYIREIPFLSFPTTSRFMPKVKRHKSESIAAKRETFQPESRISSATNSSNASSTTTITDTSDSLDKILLNQESPPYEGPKWYTSLVSNVLVTLLKLILPANSDQ